MQKLRQKLKQPAGFTLIEMLVCVAVLLLTTQLILLAVQLSVKYYTQSAKEADSQLLCTSLATAVKQELQYAMEIEPAEDGQTFTYYSRAYAHGAGCTLTSAQKQLVVEKAVENAPAVQYPLVGAQMYSNGMGAELSCRWEDAEGRFSVTVRVLSEEGQELTARDFYVYPLCKTVKKS